MLRLIKKVKNLYFDSKAFQIITYPIKLTYDFYRYHLESDRSYLFRNFYIKHGYKPNISNPKRLNEKILWLKLHDRTPLHTLCADKLAVRKYVEEKIGPEYLIPLVFSTERIRYINYENLPDYPVIIKTNHNSGGTLIVEDRNKVDFKEVNKLLKKWLKRNYYFRSREWQYKNIKPTILVEKLMLTSDGSLPDDLKFHCMHGKVEVIQVDSDRRGKHSRNLYSKDWELLPFQWHLRNKPLPNIDHDLPKPKKLETLISIAEKLAQEFYYARIDLYLINSQIYFGEITFHPGSGYEIFTPDEWDLRMGEILKLPRK